MITAAALQWIFTDSLTVIPDSKIHGANMGPTWVLSAPDGPLVGPMNLAIRDIFTLVMPEHNGQYFADNIFKRFTKSRFVLFCHNQPIVFPILEVIYRDHSGYGLSQWDPMIHCDIVSHWLSPYPVWFWHLSGSSWVMIHDFLTNWGRDKTDATSQTTCSSAVFKFKCLISD